MKRIVAGILAHVDSGKTTLSEAMLYHTGTIRKPGRVDHRNTYLDTDRIERERGITIFSKQAIIKLDNAEITLLDTPGHADFSTETERVLQILDCAILVISGTDGVQSHTETLWRLLTRYSIPVFIFINKTDMPGIDRKNIIIDPKNKLDYRCVDFENSDKDLLYEELAECDESIMQYYLDNGNVREKDILNAVRSRELFPCCFGSALKLNGIESFMETFCRYAPSSPNSESFGAKVFKITEDESGNRLTHLKITGGSLKVRSAVHGVSQDKKDWEEKINQIRIYSGEKFITANEVYSGIVCAVTGLTKTYSGEGLGMEADSDDPLLEPVLTYSVKLPDGTDPHAVIKKLRKLEEEDPQLHIIWNEQHKEIHIQLMGEIQLEILKNIIYERFDINVQFGPGSIAYKETIANKVEGVGHYEPLRHYAEVHLILEPLKRGSGLIFSTDCREDLLNKNWQRLIISHLKEKTHIGVLTGSPITDMRITLVSGRAHAKHTEGGDFRQATYRAVRHGLKCAESILLEPWYSFKIELPSENTGRALSDIQQMNGSFETPASNGELTVISGSAPVASIRDYQNEIKAYTRGKGKIYLSFKGYEPCVNSERVIDEIGYNSDSDTENTADSVFCSHGSGHVVKWNEVYDNMHLERYLKIHDSSSDIDILKKTETYYSRITDDKELMEIFERTYGPVRRDKIQAFKRRRKNTAETDNKKIKPVLKGPEYLLVDGYNIIFAWDNLKGIAKNNLDLARSQLINILCNYQAFKQCELILVFDAYKVKGNTGEIEKIHNISVVYTKEAETADMYIQKATSQIGKDRKVRVATSDGMEQLIILGNGAYRVSASEFYEEVKTVDKAIRDFIENQK